MERELETINHLDLGTVAKGLAEFEGEWRRIDGARIVKMDDGNCAFLDKGKTGRPKKLNGKIRVINIKMRET